MRQRYIIRLLAILTIPLVLSACLMMGDRVCIEQCKTTNDGSRVVFAPHHDTCNAGAGLAVAKEYVAGCHQCLDGRNYISSIGQMGLRLPSDDLLSTTIKGIWLNEQCQQQDRDAYIPKFIADRKGRHGPERYGDDYAEPEAIGNGLTVMRNRFTESYNQDIFFYKNPEGSHVFVVLCYSQGHCSSNSNPIDGAPYGFSYNFTKPADPADFIRMHEHVSTFVAKVYADASQAAELSAVK